MEGSMDYAVVKNRLAFMKSKEVRLLKLKKSQRGELRVTQTTISNLKRWLKELKG